MASAESITYGALKALVGGRVYPALAPAGVAKPYITYQAVGGQDSGTLTGINALQNKRMQINIWADSRSDVAALEMPVLTALTAPGIAGAPIGAPVSDYESDTKLYGSRIDVSIWYTP